MSGEDSCVTHRVRYVSLRRVNGCFVVLTVLVNQECVNEVRGYQTIIGAIYSGRWDWWR